MGGIIVKEQKKKKSWFAWIVFGVIVGGTVAVGIPPEVSAPLAEVASQFASDAVEFDD